jgi:hypothetical protein
MANDSLKLGRSLAWNPDKQEIVNDAEANQVLQRAYRKPWIHPA